MKGSLTAVMRTSSCSTLRVALAGLQILSGSSEKENSRIAEDDPANATEAVDADLWAVRSCQWLERP
jgi:hypothetical protein